MEVVQGGNAVLRAEFLDIGGDPVAVSINSLKIYQADGDLALDVPVIDIVEEASNRYRYTYTVPADAQMGTWEVVWVAVAVVGSQVMTGEDEFQVVVVNENALSTVPQLRILINERIPSGGTEADTRFTDNELALILVRCNYNIYAASAEGWYVKAGMFSMMIDVDESGSNRNLSDIFKHALSMGDRYRKAGADQDKELAAIYEGRIPGKAVSPWKVCEDDPNVIYPFSGYEVTYSRYFPIHRFTYGIMG